MSAPEERRRPAPTMSVLSDLVQLGQEIGEEAWILEIVADLAPEVAIRSSFRVKPGERFYDDLNFCSTCRKVYPKSIRECPVCHHKLRSRSRG